MNGVQPRQHTPYQFDWSQGRKWVLVGMGVNAGLAVLKIATGWLGHSNALVADGIDSWVDLFGSFVVWGSLRYAARPADEDHPYGHGKVEPLAALFVSILICAAGLAIAWQAVDNLTAPRDSLPAAFTLYVLIGVIVIKETLHFFVHRAGRLSGSVAVQADAWHHRSDAITSLAAALGIGMALLGGPAYAFADDAAALIASAVILFNAWRLAQTPWNELMDREPSDLLAQVRQYAEAVPDVEAVEKLAARKHGARFWVDMHLEVDAGMTVRRAHAVAHIVKEEIRDQLPLVEEVLIHIEPAGVPAPPRGMPSEPSPRPWRE